MIVDSHCHASPIWYEPVETLLFQMDRTGVGAAVLTQVLGQFDNSYQQGCLRRFPGRFASVVAVDAAEPDAVARLHRLVDEGASGLRLRADARSPGEDPLALWRAAEASGVVVSCAGPAALFVSPAFGELMRATPRLVVVLEHLGGLGRPDVGDMAAVRLKVLGLASHPNLRLKLPGLGQLAARKARLPQQGSPLDSDPRDLVRDMIAGYGAERVMWGSDFPPVAAREGYASALSWVRDDALADLTKSERDLVFGGVAAGAFGLSGA
jgi:L-fuconolactonase